MPPAPPDASVVEPPSPLLSSSSPPQPAASNASAATISARTLNQPRFLEITSCLLLHDMDRARRGSARVGAALVRADGEVSRLGRPDFNFQASHYTGLTSRSGGTGRRAGLKIRFPSGSVGSIPTFGIDRGWLAPDPSIIGRHARSSERR